MEEGFRTISVGNNSITYGSKNSSINTIQKTSDIFTSSQIISGDLPKDNEIMLSETLSNTFNDTLIGQTVTIKLSIEGTKIEKQFNLSGTYKSNGNPLSTIYITYDTLQSLYEDNNL